MYQEYNCRTSNVSERSNDLQNMDAVSSSKADGDNESNYLSSSLNNDVHASNTFVSSNDSYHGDQNTQGASSLFPAVQDGIMSAALSRRNSNIILPVSIALNIKTNRLW